MPIDPRRIEVMDDAMAEIIRAKSPAERLAITFGMWRAARRMLSASLADRNPQWTAEEVDREVARRLARGSG